MDNRAVNRVKDVLWAVVSAGLLAVLLRLGLGLGASTGLNDATPWGLWIAFKLCFVALAGGGFTLAGMVYIFHLESFRPVLRRAVLLALLGYSSFVISLLFDLGLPWHIYMPVLHWQHHSVMFEIAWCVMLYLTVLLMEFGPVILEHPRFKAPLFQRVAHLLHRATVPVVIAGIVLSTLHQASLGSLFLIMPHRVHPLWYSPWIPVLFFTSAIGAGMMALIVESFLAERLFGRGSSRDLQSRLAQAGSFALLLYLFIRLGDLAVRGVLPGALDGSWESLLFGSEILLGGVLPAVLLLAPKVRSSRAGLLSCALLAIAGVASQRMSLSMFTMWQPENAPYRPSGMEILIAFAIPAAAGLVYLAFAEHLPVFGAVTPAGQRKEPRPLLQPGALDLQEQGWPGQLVRGSGIAVLALALTIAATPAQTASGQPAALTPVEPALGWESLRIDGNRNGIAVVFPHLDHQESLSGELGDRETGCQNCHHLNLPEDSGSGCWECHRDYYATTSIFNHSLHTSALGGNTACRECHVGEKRAGTQINCLDCHETMSPAAGETAFKDLAPGYQEAMHGACQSCHEEQAAATGNPGLAACATCHFKESEAIELAGRVIQSIPFGIQ